MKAEVKYKPIEPVKPELESITITLDKKEVMFLQAILGKINGSDSVGFRKFLGELWKTLYEETKELYPYEYHISGLLTTK